MSKTSKFLADLSAYEAMKKTPPDPSVPRLKGRTAPLLIAALLTSLVALTYILMEISMSPSRIAWLELTLFGIAGIVGSLRIYCARKSQSTTT
jgi:hypothetical protein